MKKAVVFVGVVSLTIITGCGATPPQPTTTPPIGATTTADYIATVSGWANRLASETATISEETVAAQEGSFPTSALASQAQMTANTAKRALTAMMGLRPPIGDQHAYQNTINALMALNGSLVELVHDARDNNAVAVQRDMTQTEAWTSALEATVPALNPTIPPIPNGNGS